jgi:hypothetical protein
MALVAVHNQHGKMLKWICIIDTVHSVCICEQPGSQSGSAAGGLEERPVIIFYICVWLSVTYCLQIPPFTGLLQCRVVMKGLESSSTASAASVPDTLIDKTFQNVLTCYMRYTVICCDTGQFTAIRNGWVCRRKLALSKALIWSISVGGRKWQKCHLFEV